LPICCQAWRTLPCSLLEGQAAPSGRRRFSLMSGLSGPENERVTRSQNRQAGERCDAEIASPNTARARSVDESTPRGACPTSSRYRRRSSVLRAEVRRHPTGYEMTVYFTVDTTIPEDVIITQDAPGNVVYLDGSGDPANGPSLTVFGSIIGTSDSFLETLGGIRAEGATEPRSASDLRAGLRTFPTTA
jgi:hypothetical protein